MVLSVQYSLIYPNNAVKKLFNNKRNIYDNLLELN